MSVTLRRAVCSLVVLLSSAALLLAQQAQPAQPRTGQPRVQPAQPGLQPGQPRVQPGQPGQFGRPGQPGLQAQQLEPSIITLLIIDNNKEIAFGQLGQQTSDNQQVKEFCQMIVKQHSDFVEKLQERSAAGGRAPRLGTAPGAGPATVATQPGRPAAPGGALREETETQRDLAAQPDRAQDQPGQERRTATAQDRSRPGQERESRTAADRQGGEQRIVVAKPVIGNQPGSELLQLHHEIAAACLERARRDAQRHRGSEFDTNFMGAQIVAHKEMLDKLQVFQQHVSPQVRQLLADAQKTTQKHLEDAMSLHQEISKESGRDAAAGATRERRTEPRQERE